MSQQPADSDTALWLAPDDSSSAVDLGGERVRPISDRYKVSRATLSAIMDDLAQLYAAVRNSGPAQVVEQITGIHDALGRVKIGLLPPRR